LWHTEPLNYRRQNAGDYEIPALTLRPDLAKGKTGLGIHLQDSN
jgi:NAD(P)H dehydrogenase (quinone)